MEFQHTTAQLALPLGISPTKYCPGCKQYRPHSDFNKASARADGLQSTCRACFKERYAPKPQPKPDRFTDDGRRICSKCGETGEFNKRKGYCKVCQKAMRHDWYVRHADQEKAKARADHAARQASDPAYRRRNVQRAAAWEKAHPERVKELRRASRDRRRDKVALYRAMHRAEFKAYYAEWKRKNPHVRRQHDAKRRAWMRSTAVGKVDYAAILSRYGYVCHICGDAINPQNLEFDHVIPLSKGGPHVEENIKPSHGRCNNRKKARILT